MKKWKDDPCWRSLCRKRLISTHRYFEIGGSDRTLLVQALYAHLLTPSGLSNTHRKYAKVIHAMDPDLQGENVQNRRPCMRSRAMALCLVLENTQE